MLIKIISPDFLHADERGTLVQLVHAGYAQVNVVTSKAGVVRGGHYHKECNEVFYVVNGKFKFIAQKEDVRETYEFSAGDMFLVPPGIIHEFHYTQETLLVALYNNGVEHADGTKDIFPAELC